MHYRANETKQLVESGGENVASREVEEVLPAVIDLPDVRWVEAGRSPQAVLPDWGDSRCPNG
jgi:acyl-CoA synthetase (AMP-forming)/AMP-acid ligase II